MSWVALGESCLTQEQQLKFWRQRIKQIDLTAVLQGSIATGNIADEREKVGDGMERWKGSGQTTVEVVKGR